MGCSGGGRGGDGVDRGLVALFALQQVQLPIDMLDTCNHNFINLALPS